MNGDYDDGMTGQYDSYGDPVPTDDSFKSHAFNTLINPNSEQLKSLAILGPASVNKLAMIVTMQKATDKKRFKYNNGAFSHHALSDIFTDNILRLSRSVKGTGMDHGTIILEREAEARTEEKYYGRG